MCGVQACSRTTPIFRTPTRHNEDPDRRYERGARPSLERPVKRAAGKWPREEPPGGARAQRVLQRGFPPPRNSPTNICEIGSCPRDCFLTQGSPYSGSHTRSATPLATTPPGLAGGLARVSEGHPAQDQPPQSLRMPSRRPKRKTSRKRGQVTRKRNSRTTQGIGGIGAPSSSP